MIVQGFSGKASGGGVDQGTPYMVGERGPELFVPGRSGAIVSNGALGTQTSAGPVNVYVNVDATGSSSKSTGDEDSRNAQVLGQRMGDAVRAILDDESRPGGRLWKVQRR
jgi:phage-related minor tail protein